jgi:hypothetical protein
MEQMQSDWYEAVLVQVCLILVLIQLDLIVLQFIGVLFVVLLDRLYKCLRLPRKVEIYFEFFFSP